MTFKHFDYLCTEHSKHQGVFTDGVLIVILSHRHWLELEVRCSVVVSAQSSSRVIPSLLSEAASFIKVFLILSAGWRTLLSSCQHSAISAERPDRI